jgi:hypothetical protein
MYNGDGSLGVPADHVKAAQLFLKAAQAGNAQAMNNLGVMYSQGKGLPRDIDQAIRWWKKAIEVDGNGASGKAAQSWLQMYNNKDSTNTPKSNFNSLSSNLLTQLQALFNQISTDTKPIYFSIAGVHYLVPRNYLVFMNNWSGGSQTQVQFKVTFPGLHPMEDNTKECLLSTNNSSSQCAPLEFWLVQGNALSDEQVFESQKERLDSQTSKAGAAGFEVYTITVPKKIEPFTVDRYRKKVAARTLIIDCAYGVLQNGNRYAHCDNLYGSPLSNGNGISYRIALSQIENAEEIDNGIRALIESFAVKADRP